MAYRSLPVEPAVRQVRCQAFDEEPSEFLCRWLQRGESGEWRAWSTYLAVDGSGFRLIDDPGQMRESAAGRSESKSSTDDAQFRTWLVRYLADRPGVPDPNAVYGYALADLNGDGRDEAVVWARDSSDCGSGGCDLYVFVRDKSGWRRLSSTFITRPPIKILPTSTHGWRDLAAWEAGGGIERPFEARLRFNGHNYEIQWPPDWTGQKPPPLLGGRVLIADAKLALFPGKCRRVQEVPSVFGPVPITSKKAGSC